MSMWRTIIATTVVLLAFANAISENSAEGTHLIKKRLGGRYFRRPWSTKDWYKRNGDDFYTYNSDSDHMAEKRGGGRFVNYMGDFDQSPYQLQKRPGARFLGGSGAYGYYGGYNKRPGRRFYRSIDEIERIKKPGARFMSFNNPQIGKRYDDEDDESYEERYKRSRYGYPSWLRGRSG